MISGRVGLGDRPVTESVKHSFRLRGAEVFHTAEDGCVWALIDEVGVVISSHRSHVRAGDASVSSAELLQTE